MKHERTQYPTYMLQGAIELTSQAHILHFDEASRTTRSRSGERYGQDRQAARSRIVPSERARVRQGSNSGQEKRAGSRRADDAAPARGERSSRERNSHSARDGARTNGVFQTAVRSRRKAKADRAFDRRYASQDVPAESGSRAAVYRGQMGSSHKKSARMQNQEASKRRQGFPTKKKGMRSSPVLYSVLAVTACIVFACVFVYPAARDYYVTMRAEARLQAEYDALSARYDAIQSEVDRLSTSEGIEDEARSEFGWVKEGENAVNVYGLDEDGQEAVYADIPIGGVEAPVTWYSTFLDPLFGVDPGTVSEEG